MSSEMRNEADNLSTMSFYEAVYSQDNPLAPTSGWIQWKGTNICIDVDCQCGYGCHVDGGFFYYWKCPECDAIYAVGQSVKFIPLTGEQVRQVRGNPCAYVGEDGPKAL